MILTSSNFKNGENIPRKHASYDQNFAPNLSWSELPANAQSLVLICDDPDAVKPAGKIWVHWVVYNIPAAKGGTPFAKPAVCGPTDFGTSKYDGPNPPDGEHRYFFELFALSVAELSLTERITRDEFRHKYAAQILGSGLLMAKHNKKTIE